MEPHQKEDDSLGVDQGSQEDNLQSLSVLALIVLIRYSNNFPQLRAGIVMLEDLLSHIKCINPSKV